MARTSFAQRLQLEDTLKILPDRLMVLVLEPSVCQPALSDRASSGSSPSSCSRMTRSSALERSCPQPHKSTSVRREVRVSLDVRDGLVKLQSTTENSFRELSSYRGSCLFEW